MPLKCSCNAKLSTFVIPKTSKKQQVEKSISSIKKTPVKCNTSKASVRGGGQKTTLDKKNSAKNKNKNQNNTRNKSRTNTRKQTPKSSAPLLSISLLALIGLAGIGYFLYSNNQPLQASDKSKSTPGFLNNTESKKLEKDLPEQGLNHIVFPSQHKTHNVQSYSPQAKDPFKEKVLNDQRGISSIIKEVNQANEGWRKEANEKINRIRKTDMIVKVVDRLNNPVSGIKLDIEQKNHKFTFGTVVTRYDFMEKSEHPKWTAEKYYNLKYTIEERYKLVSLFANQIGFDNALKFKLTGTPFAQTNGGIVANTIIPRMRKMGISVRGHCLIWPGWDH
ncbi:MAG: hypothetical protein HQL32_08705, partial [Planctomycetes bacterium]|nr:hypothetical protein [Planctomycetota bacterium]